MIDAFIATCITIICRLCSIASRLMRIQAARLNPRIRERAGKEGWNGIRENALRGRAKFGQPAQR